MKTVHPKQHRGVVMLLALLLLAAVTASTIGVALTISQTTSQSTNLDNFILASLAGDSGIERSLAVVKNYRNSGTITGAVSAMTNAMATAQNVNPSSARGQFAGLARSSSDPITLPNLRPNESSSFDLFGYDASGNLATNTTARYLYLRASPPSGVTTANWRAKLEVSWVMLDTAGDSTCTGRYFVDTSALQNGVSPYLLNGTLNQLGETCTEVNPKGFRVKVRALDSSDITATTTQKTVSNLTIDAYPCNVVAGVPCAPVGIPGRIQIDITGTTGNSKALKTASILWQLPVSGLFNYVLFSEGDIIPN